MNSDPTAEKNEPRIIAGMAEFPISELLKPCLPDLEPCDKKMWEHCNENIKATLDDWADRLKKAEERNERLEAALRKSRKACEYYKVGGTFPIDGDMATRTIAEIDDAISDKKGTV